jgi:hypothetical protein
MRKIAGFFLLETVAGAICSKGAPAQRGTEGVSFNLLHQSSFKNLAGIHFSRSKMAHAYPKKGNPEYEEKRFHPDF